MERCLILARQGEGMVAPNPLVGCVIIQGREIIGEGYHSAFGFPHAEAEAIASVADPSHLKGATLIVNLEPCAHFGKTPPCADIIIKSGIGKVVLGAQDPNSLVAGKGILKLKSAGIEVIEGMLEKESKELNKEFFCYHTKKRPYIILKWAQTQDTFISLPPPFTKENNHITSSFSDTLSHLWRSRKQSIWIGTNTALLDQPRLTVRKISGKNPIRIVIDRNNSIPRHHPLFSKEAETWIYHSKDCSFSPPQSDIKVIPIDFSSSVPRQILNHLYQSQIITVLVEGGAFLLKSLIDADLWDEARIYTGAHSFQSGLESPVLKNAILKQSLKLGKDTLQVFIRDTALPRESLPE